MKTVFFVFVVLDQMPLRFYKDSIYTRDKEQIAHWKCNAHYLVHFVIELMMGRWIYFVWMNRSIWLFDVIYIKLKENKQMNEFIFQIKFIE